jgi:hypothetical protein
VWCNASMPQMSADVAGEAGRAGLGSGEAGDRVHGNRNIAAALRRNARDATRVLPLLGITSP